MKIVFVGTSELGIPSLEALVAQGRHEIQLITKPDQQGGRGRGRIVSPLTRAGQDLGLSIQQPQDINAEETIAWLKAYSPRVMVVASYWARLGNPLLSVPELGAINIHPSLLPRFRGAAPIQHALLQGDPVTGVTLFQIVARMDAGDILGQVEVIVDPEDNAQTLHDRLARASAPLLLRVLEEMDSGTAQPRPQNHAERVLARKLSKAQGAMDWTRNAVELERMVRALWPWPGAFTFCPGKKRPIRLIVARSRVAVESELPGGGRPGEVANLTGRLVIYCGKGALELLLVQREGKKVMSAEELLRGLNLGPGGCLDSGQLDP